MEEWTNEELNELASTAYQKKRVSCPRCQARVVVRLRKSQGRKTVPLVLQCERCGTYGRYSPDHLEEMRLKWSKEDKIRILERYWAHKRVVCPNDGAVLVVHESKVWKPPPKDLYFRCPHCGRDFQSNETEKSPEPDSFEAQYDEVRQLGAGGMGEVILFKEKSSGDHVAVKKILPQFIRDVDAVKRFRRETRILSSLTHPNIVPIRNSFLDDSGGLVVMEYLSGGTLTEHINDPSIDPSLLRRYFEDAVAGVSYLHSQGVIHRDLKPDNVLIDKSGRAHVSDFGLARLLDRDSTTLTERGAFLGTLLYAAPEQQEDAAEVDAKCDIYALGLIAYEIAKRQSPYRTPVDSSSLENELRKALPRALAPRPQDRPKSGDFLVRALQGRSGGS